MGVIMESGGEMLMDGVWISQVEKGVEVMGKGRLVVIGGEIGFKGEHGVYLDKGGVAFLGEVNIKGNGTGKEGIKLNGGMVDLYRTDIRDVYKGVSVENGIVRMEGGEIGFMSGVGNGNYGVKVGSEGNALLNSVSITGSGREGTGTGVVMDGKMLMMSDVRISGVKMGVEVSEGNLVMHKGSIGFTGNYGIYLIRGNALFYGVSITGSGDKSTGMYVGSSGKIIMKDVMMSGVGVGAWVTNGGAMWLGGINLRDVQNGMIVTESTVGMEGGEITFKGSYGVYLGKSRAALKDVKMTYMGRNDAVDFMTVQGGKVIAKDIQIYGNGYGQGVKVNGGYVVLIRPSLNKVRTGVTIQNAEVTMISSSITLLEITA
ncbi:hypothetical protein m02_10140, partial [Bartonella bovis m02]